MKKLKLSEEYIIQNLKDAGCDDSTIDTFMCTLQDGRSVCCEKLLECHRRELLETLHKEQKKIDCLDYLIYNMQKQAAAD